ncbi:MAG: methylated-DNA--[protein]-cysteine S-methyltransferase [Eubacteriales bacterium]
MPAKCDVSRDMQLIAFEAGPGWLAAAFSDAGLFALALPRGRVVEALEDIAAETRLPAGEVERRVKYLRTRGPADDESKGPGPKRGRTGGGVSAGPAPERGPVNGGVSGGTALALAVQARRYFAGEKVGFTADIDWSGYTPFQKQVLKAVRGIPYGAVLAYGEVARLVGRPGAARAVGGVMRANRTPLIVPCHRVVASGGLGGFGCGIALKRYMLELEGWGKNGS